VRCAAALEPEASAGEVFASAAGAADAVLQNGRRQPGRRRRAAVRLILVQGLETAAAMWRVHPDPSAVGGRSVAPRAGVLLQ
jgi:hypothetical protein